MPLIIGVSLALAVGVLYTIFRLDRDRAFYPTVMIVIASYYALFAVMGASTHTLVLELLAGAVFLLAAVYGFRTSLWVVAAALAAQQALAGTAAHPHPHSLGCPWLRPPRDPNPVCQAGV